MIDAHPGLRASSSAELDAVAAAQQWLVDQGLALPPTEASSTVRSTRPRVRGPGSVSAAPGSVEVEPSDRDLSHPGRAELETQARAVVLRKLSAQARTRHELDQALRAKEVPADIADQVLDGMEDVGLVDDAAFAHDWVNSRQQRRQLSRRALGRELKNRGVSQDQIDDALANVGSAEEYGSAITLAARRYRSMSELPRDVVRRRLTGALARRGFASGVITRVLAEVVDQRPPGTG